MLIDASTGSASTLRTFDRAQSRAKAEWVDTHAHLNFAAFVRDRERVIKKCLQEGVWMINVGTNFFTSKKAVEIAQKYEKGVFATIGLHPINLDTGLVKIKADDLEGNNFEKEFNYEKYKKLAKSEKVVAIGEIGLDYYYRPKTSKKKEIFKQKQKELFLKELELANELNLPIIFHCRMAHNDLIKELRITDYGLRIRGVMHGFVGTQEQLQEYLKMGFYIGFNGIIFKKIEGIDFEKVIKETPLDKILVETDCPYLSPPIGVNQRINQRKSAAIRNDPFGVNFVIEKIAIIKNENFEKVSKQVFENAQNLFALTKK